jgi:hypothetical protein
MMQIQFGMLMLAQKEWVSGHHAFWRVSNAIQQ